MSSEKTKQAEQTRKRIKRTATRLFAQKGFDQVSVREICTKVGVSVGTFYHYYPSKEHIFLENRTAQGQRLHQCLEESGSLPVSSQIIHLACCYAADVEQAGVDVIQVLYNPKGASRRDQRQLRDIFLSITEGMEQNQLLVDTLIVCIQGVVYDWCKNEGKYALEEKMRVHLELLASGWAPMAAKGVE